MRHPLPLLRPRDPLHPQAAGGTPDPVRRLDEPEGLVPQGQVLPPAFRSAGPRNLGGWAAAHPATELPARQAIDPGQRVHRERVVR